VTRDEDPAAPVAHHDSSGSLPQAQPGHSVSIPALFCASASLVTTCLGFSQFDLPVTRYVRSVTIHLPWDQLVVPWMAFTSNAGNWIGEGSHLVAVSAVLLAIGWSLKKQVFKEAGFQSLLAHGLAAALGNGLKHLIGRPRPKFVHSGEWQFTPSWASGLDSFPSGHTMASFAVATVLAKRFPVFGPLCLCIAAFVGLSRILRGSHFPTDVLGGAILGVLSGVITSAPLKQWRRSIQEGLLQAAVGSCTALAVLWTLSHQVERGSSGLLLIVLGAVAVGSGLWLRRTIWFGADQTAVAWTAKVSLALIAYGLAAMTTSPFVLASGGFACLAFWFTGAGLSEEQRPDSPAWNYMKEGLLLGGLLLALVLLYDGRGTLPFH
jgi:membrane-associated phospholipid phosphatase